MLSKPPSPLTTLTLNNTCTTFKIAELLAYLDTDTLRFRSELPVPLYEEQCALWDPMIKWFEDRHGVEVCEMAEGLSDTTFRTPLPTSPPPSSLSPLQPNN